MEGKIHEFFQHLIAYGGVSIEKGVIYMWSDPNIFFPFRSFAHFHYRLKDLLAEDANDYPYLLGRIYGRNAVKIMVQKFGFKVKDLQDFLRGASQDGFGFCRLEKISDYEKEKLVGTIKLENQGMSKQVLEEHGIQKEGYDSYLCGINAGGGEVAFEKEMDCYEMTCIARGDKECTIWFGEVEKRKELKVLKIFNTTEEELVAQAFSVYSKRQRGFKIITSRDIQLGDGQLFFKGIKGVVFPAHMLVLSDKLLHEKFQERYENIVEEMAALSIEAIYDEKIKFSMNAQIIQKMLDKLSIFGFGEFKIERIGEGRIWISNENNTYAEDYRAIYGVQKSAVNMHERFLIAKLCERYMQRKAAVIETVCKAKGMQKCVFEVTLG